MERQFLDTICGRWYTYIWHQIQYNWQFICLVPPTICTEVADQIKQHSTGKAPEIDFIIAEVLQNNLDWWTLVFASVYTDYTAMIPKDCDHVLIIPIYNKGNWTFPANYYPISLLALSGKYSICQTLIRNISRLLISIEHVSQKISYIQK